MPDWIAWAVVALAAFVFVLPLIMVVFVVIADRVWWPIMRWILRLGKHDA